MKEVTITLTEQEARWLSNLVEDHVLNAPYRQATSRRKVASDIVEKIDEALENE